MRAVLVTHTVVANEYLTCMAVWYRYRCLVESSTRGLNLAFSSTFSVSMPYLSMVSAISLLIVTDR